MKVIFNFMILLAAIIQVSSANATERQFTGSVSWIQSITNNNEPKLHGKVLVGLSSYAGSSCTSLYIEQTDFSSLALLTALRMKNPDGSLKTATIWFDDAKRTIDSSSCAIIAIRH